jgi:hypothetical protein
MARAVVSIVHEGVDATSAMERAHGRH